MPAVPEPWLEVERAELSRHSARTPAGGLAYRSRTLFFLTPKSGSGDAFHVSWCVKRMPCSWRIRRSWLRPISRHHLSLDEVRAQLGQAPGGERFTPVSRAGEGHLQDLRVLPGIDPAWTASARRGSRAANPSALKASISSATWVALARWSSAI